MHCTKKELVDFLKAYKNTDICKGYFAIFIEGNLVEMPRTINPGTTKTEKKIKPDRPKDPKKP